jgi:hypothetical protein
MGNYLACSNNQAQNWAGNLSWSSGSFNTNGFTLVPGTNSSTTQSGDLFASWTFRKQPKFFDIQTYTGTGSAQTISHNLGSTPGCIIVKRTDSTNNWAVYHNGFNSGTNPQNYYALLNTTAGTTSSSAYWNNTAPTSSNFTIGTSSDVNSVGGTYIVYIFGAGGTGGFGLTGTQDIISCGSFTTGTGLVNVNIGWEPQYILLKDITSSTDWIIVDNIRGIFSQDSTTGSPIQNPNTLAADSSASEVTTNTQLAINANGFSSYGVGAGSAGDKWIYMAIRRGPMAIPTTGTNVFKPTQYTGGTTNTYLNCGFPVDTSIFVDQTGTGLGGYEWTTFSRLQGVVNAFNTTQTAAWGGGWGSGYLKIDNNIGVFLSTSTGFLNRTGDSFVEYSFGRAPGFFDMVTFTGNASSQTINHNLGVTPQLIIIKAVDTASNWGVYHSALGATQYLLFNSANTAAYGSGYWNNTAPTSTQFTVGTSADTNSTGQNTAWLFATCPGVSYVGSYTGNGGTQTINCGFTGGARFVLIKQTSSTGNWTFYDTARGMVSGADYYQYFNTTASVTNSNTVYSVTGGFQLYLNNNSLNTSGATYIFLAIA